MTSGDTEPIDVETCNAASDVESSSSNVPNDVPVVREVIEQCEVGDVVGQCKWFSDKLGYGFITIQSGENKGKDIFVHHSGIKPLNSNYKTLRKGEYVNFKLIDGDNGLQAVNVTGIGGGSLMCDVIPSVKFSVPTSGPPGQSMGQKPPPPPPREYPGDFQTVSYRRVPPMGGRGGVPSTPRSGPGGGRGAFVPRGGPGRGRGGRTV